MLAMADTIRELRGNLVSLKSVIEGVLVGRGRIGLWPYGPYLEQSQDQTIDLTRRQMAERP
jgi:hypothetical protein